MEHKKSAVETALDKISGLNSDFRDGEVCYRPLVVGLLWKVVSCGVGRLAWGVSVVGTGDERCCSENI